MVAGRRPRGQPWVSAHQPQHWPSAPLAAVKCHVDTTPGRPQQLLQRLTPRKLSQEAGCRQQDGSGDEVLQ